MLFALRGLPRPRLNWGHTARGARLIPPLDVRHRALLVEDSGIEFGVEKSSLARVARHREAAVRTPSIVGDRSLGVRADRTAPPLYLFRCRKLGTKSRQLPDAAGASGAA